jgi:predicted transcriptional regulator
VKRNGKTWFPVRRIRNSLRILEEEILNAGMDILWMGTVPPMDEHDTGTFRARCCKKRLDKI